MRRKTGRPIFANPGPTNIPDSILRAMDRATIDFNDPDFLDVYDRCIAGLKRVLRTERGELFMYTASGHGAWEAALLNLLSPGDAVLVPEAGWFAEGWLAMAERLGLRPRKITFDWRRGVDPDAVARALREDAGHEIKAVMCVHSETSTGMATALDQVRAAIDAAGHPALLMVDTISSLGSLEFRMDEWGIDAVVGGSQKGLMLPTGFSFTAVSEKGMKAHETARLPRAYFDWGQMRGRRHRSFMGTVPITLFYGLQESLRLIEEEGLDNVTARHRRLAEAVRRAVRAWQGNNGPQLFCAEPARFSDSVTAVLMPERFDAEAIRQTALDRFNVSLGGGLGRLGGRVFRIGHLGDLNEAMVLGVLGAVEMSLRLNRVPHGPGGVAAALDWLTEQAASGAAAPG